MVLSYLVSILVEGFLDFLIAVACWDLAYDYPLERVAFRYVEKVTGMVPLETVTIERRCSSCRIDVDRLNMSPPVAIVTPPLTKVPSSWTIISILVF